MNNSENMRLLRTYKQALEHYNGVTPLKSGTKKGRRPWGMNRRAIKLLVDKADCGSLSVKLYENEVLRYRPDGITEFSLCGYNSPSTRDVIYYSTGLRVETKRSQPFLVVGGKSYLFNKVLEVDCANGVVLNPDVQTVWRLNRKAMTGLRKEFTPFLSYCQAMGSLHTEITKDDLHAAAAHIDDNVPHPVYGSKLKIVETTGRKQYQTTWEYMSAMVGKIRKAQEVEDLQEYRARFIQLCASAGFFSWRHHTWHTSQVNFAKPAIDKFCEVLKYVYADKLFTKEVLPVGTGVADTNFKYIKHFSASCGFVN